MGKNILHCISMCVVFVSCGLDQIGEAAHSNADGIWHGPSYGKHMKGTWYAAGIDYPEGYDWIADVGKGSVECSVVLFADGVPVLRVPVGDNHQVSSDPERHRIVSGYLYSDYTDGSCTVVKRDGVPIYMSDVAELVEDIKVADGAVYVLSSLSGREGFTYRVDGNLVVERSSGSSFRRMDVCSDTVFFYFSQSVKVAEGQVISYYKVEDGKVTLMNPDFEGQILDIRRFDGDVFLSSDKDSKVSVLVHGRESVRLKPSFTAQMLSASFISDVEPFVSVRYANPLTGQMTDVLWRGKDDWKICRFGSAHSASCVDDEGYYAAINSHDGMDGIIFSEDQAHVMPDGYYVYGRNCLLRKNGVLYAGLSSSERKPPMVWKDGVLDTLDINGPLIFLQ